MHIATDDTDPASTPGTDKAHGGVGFDQVAYVARSASESPMDQDHYTDLITPSSVQIRVIGG
jgi:hypothetical protein